MVLSKLKVNIWIMKAFRIEGNINTLLQYYENVFMLDKEMAVIRCLCVWCAWKFLNFVLCSDSSGISRIADGFNGIFSDHCYSVCSMRQPDLKYFDNKGIFKFSKIVSFKLLL